MDVKLLVFSVLRIAPNGLHISSNRYRYSSASSMRTRALTLLPYPITIGTPPCSSSFFDFFLVCVMNFLRRWVWIFLVMWRRTVLAKLGIIGLVNPFSTGIHFHVPSSFLTILLLVIHIRGQCNLLVVGILVI